MSTVSEIIVSTYAQYEPYKGVKLVVCCPVFGGPDWYLCEDWRFVQDPRAAKAFRGYRQTVNFLISAELNCKEVQRTEALRAIGICTALTYRTALRRWNDPDVTPEDRLLGRRLTIAELAAGDYVV